MIHRYSKSRGVSLLEALVALAVMAIGTGAVLAIQSTLRLNGDVSKQRAEAVRFAQRVVEEWRGYQSLVADGAAVDWTDIVSSGAPVTLTGSNANFDRSITVLPVAGADQPRSKNVHVSVNWTDRANNAQSIVVNSVISGVPPELAGSLSIPGSGAQTRNPFGRNAGIPRDAVDQGDGTSSFEPPNAGTVRWIFNNADGFITQICLGTVCTGAKARLVSGFVRFATGIVQPTPAEAENPTGSAVPLGVEVHRTAPAIDTVVCFTGSFSTFIPYFCAVPVDTVALTWSGSVDIAGLTLATSIADVNPAAFRVCRYTTFRNNGLVVPNDLKNIDHPLVYVNVLESLSNQNFLVIRAGFGGTAFACPDDNTSTPNIQSSTWHHQPAT